ncbi:MAG TPA: serine protein kinase RIO [Methanosarcinaceae archaeon]|nr:serine protein kinase RIO [Methanosarcinaceae archaeon]
MKNYEKNVQRIDTKVDKMRMRRKDTDSIKVKENVFDTTTLKTLYTLSNKGIIQALGGSISTGKEANVFLAEGENNECAIKIYRISTSTFNSMEEYILGDPRFENIRHRKRDIIFAWTRKELRNLLRAQKAGIRVPEPITTERNILIMEFLGEDGIPYPLLKDISLDSEVALNIFDIIKEYMRKLFKDAKLVHGDLSEYNIMIDTNDMTPIIIDMGQAVTLEHPRADVFLRRDINNILRFFKRFKITTSPEDMYSFIRNGENKT